jgi:hypothetical protein
MAYHAKRQLGFQHIDNLSVTKGASFCSSAWQNPSLTFMALTVRAVDYAARKCSGDAFNWRLNPTLKIQKSIHE